MEASRSTVSRTLLRRSLTETATSRSPTRRTPGKSLTATSMPASCPRDIRPVLLNHVARLICDLIQPMELPQIVGDQNFENLLAEVLHILLLLPEVAEVDGPRGLLVDLPAGLDVPQVVDVLGGGGELGQQQAEQGVLDGTEVVRVVPPILHDVGHQILEREQLLVPFVLELGDDLLQALAEELVAGRVLAAVHLDVVPDGVLHLRGLGP